MKKGLETKNINKKKKDKRINRINKMKYNKRNYNYLIKCTLILNINPLSMKSKKNSVLGIISFVLNIRSKVNQELNSSKLLREIRKSLR